MDISLNSPGREVATIDDVDRGIIAELHKDGRAPYSRIASTLGVSAATVGRRYDALESTGVVRVVAATHVERLGLGTPFNTRFYAPAQDDLPLLADRLKKHRTIRFASSLLGPADIVAEGVLARDGDFRAMLRELLEGTSIRSESALVTRTFKSNQDWNPLPGSRREKTQPNPLDTRGESPPNCSGAADLSEAEARVLSTLMQNGRTPLGALADSIGKSEASAGRYIETLRRKGLLDLRILVEPIVLGFNVEFMMWLETSPSDLNSAAIALAQNPNVKYLAATSGKFNLQAQVALPRATDIYPFQSDVLGAVQGVRSAEIGIQEETHKRVWTSMEHGRYSSAGEPLDLLALIGH